MVCFSYKQQAKKGTAERTLSHVSRTARLSLAQAGVLGLLGLLGTLTLGSAPAAGADALQDKSDRFLTSKMAAKPTTGWSSLIVKTGGALTPVQRQQIQSLGGYVYRHLDVIESVAVRIPNKNVHKLASLSFVTRLSADATVKKTDEFTVEHSGAHVAWQNYGVSGSGVAVAVVDSGIYAHKDLTDGSKSRILAGINLTGTNDAVGTDACGHGSHVAGIIAGNGLSSTGPDYYRTFYGVARGASLVDVRVLNGQGQGNVSDVIKGIDWVISYNGNKRNPTKIRVMNLSLGRPVGESYKTDPLCLAVEKAWKAGIVVVTAAGNNGRLQDVENTTLDNQGYGTAYGSIQSPGNSPYVITVGAMKPDSNGSNNRSIDRIATYSSRGPSRLDYVMKPDLVAPGNQVIATQGDNKSFLGYNFSANRVILTDYSYKSNTKVSGYYFRLSGTSMAAPVVSGAVALMLQANPNLSPDTVKARLMLSADKWAGPDGTPDPCTYGAGYLNIPAALSNTFVASEYSLSPQLAQDENGNVYLQALGDATGTRAIWGKFGTVEELRAIWGKSFFDSSLIDGTRAIWGKTVLENSRAIWGKSVWYDQAIWGASESNADLSGTAVFGER